MLKLRDGIVELFRKVATSLPSDVEEAVRVAGERESSPEAREALGRIIENGSQARRSGAPLCLKAGFPVFYVKVPQGLSQLAIREVILAATRRAAEKIPLTLGGVDSITGEESVAPGEEPPLIFMEETGGRSLVVDLVLRGCECEGLGGTCALPLSPEGGTGEILDGLRSFVLDAVRRAGGRGCPPYTIGVALGGAREQVSLLSGRQLLRRISDSHPSEEIAGLEAELLGEINRLGIGPGGGGGETTALAVKIGIAGRQPSSCLVDVSFSCRANRRGRLVW